MIRGNITTKDVLAHPLEIAHLFGHATALRAVICAVSPRSFTFTDVVSSTHPHRLEEQMTEITREIKVDSLKGDKDES